MYTKFEDYSFNSLTKINMDNMRKKKKRKIGKINRRIRAVSLNLNSIIQLLILHMYTRFEDTRPRDYKKIMLNSAEHEILNARKYK